MKESFEIFDFRRIFMGEAPLTFLLEIIFRTVVMYTYAVVLLRILGKRGRGQLSTLEVAIIIAFGSAVGDPMIEAEVPLLYGMVSITVVTILEIGFERFINRNKKIEAFVEGTPKLIIDNGLIKLDCLKKENLSKEDLFRSLRSKDVEHLGQVNKAFFEISGEISVFFHSPKKVKPGLSVLPEIEVPPAFIIKAFTPIEKQGLYCCNSCGNVKRFKQNEKVSKCKLCFGEEWLKATEGKD